jgi:uncharacterized tellurite resistance protein B-like protein
MGILDKLMGKRGSQENSEQRGYVEAMLMMIAADGVIEDEEIRDFLKNVYSKPKLSGLSESELMSLVRRSLNAIQTEGVDARIKAIGQMLPMLEQKIEAVRLSLSICSSDGDVAPEELDILRKMQAQFDISEKQMEALLNE